MQATINTPHLNPPQLTIVGDDADTSVMPQMIQAGVYEPHIQALFNAVVQKTDVVLDIGANYGQHTAYLCRLAKHVYAVEASHDNFKYCRETLTLNRCENYTLINMGVWNKRDKLTFSHASTNAGCSYFSTEDWHQDNETLEILDVETIDNIFPIHVYGIPDFIKMDIEGSELMALEGGKKVFSANKKLLVELNKFTAKSFMNIEIATLIDKITDYGYNKCRIFHSGWWKEIHIDALKALFDSGHVLIDTFLMKE